MSEKQIKSRQRVADHGEVFTGDREVNAMLDLVKDETERIDSRFLEPACGEGAFLKKILERKLKVVADNYKKNENSYTKNSILALMSVYGVELLSDNAQVCRDNLYNIWVETYKKDMKHEPSAIYCDTAKFILLKNITVGNALTLKCVDDQQKDTDRFITFCEWNFVTGDKVKRRDFRLDILLADESASKKEDQLSLNLFGDDALAADYWMTDENGMVVPAPIKEYPLTNYWEVMKYE